MKNLTKRSFFSTSTKTVPIKVRECTKGVGMEMVQNNKGDEYVGNGRVENKMGSGCQSTGWQG